MANSELRSGRPIRRALISVYDKTGIVEFARALHDEFGIEIISTGGTAKTLRDAGIPVTLIEDITGFPELLDGRVKTLHPKIHAAILADRDNPEHMRQLKDHGIEPIDLVVVNLYPFEQTVANPNCTFEQAIEMIDIGGVALLRAAAKNRLLIVQNVPQATSAVVAALRTAVHTHVATDLDRLCEYSALFAFETTRLYEQAIASYFASHLFANSDAPYPSRELLQDINFGLCKLGDFRYGENPHQHGAGYRIYARPVRLRPLDLEVAQALSFNNLVDAGAALDLCTELSRKSVRFGDRHSAGRAACCFVKHTNACGVGVHADALEAYRRAYVGDANAAMGGILAVNLDVTPDFAATVMETYDRFGKAAGAGGFFVEVWVAPSFDDEAVKIIRTCKKWGENVRFIAVGDMTIEPDPDELQYRSVAGGMLVQTPDLIGLNEDQWKVVTKRPPTNGEMTDLRLAWLIAKHTKSNAISICKDGMLIGNGAGQMSRVMSCRIATWLAKENGHAEKLAGSAAASDAFFPFRDGPDILIDAGVTAIIQPGGSKRDEDSIRACDERGVAMIFTGTRHFRH